MKKNLIVLVFLAISTLLIALPVSQQQALQVAQNHLQLHNKNDLQIASVSAVKNELSPNAAWVYHLQPQGFIIVTSNTDLVPVYAYSFRNEFSTQELPRNTGLIMLKEDIKLRTQAVSLTDPQLISQNNDRWQAYLNNEISLPSSRDRSVFPPSSYSTPTGGWVITQWDQGYPFNQYCPVDPDAGGRSVVGCVATSFAQVVNYHREIGDLAFDDNDDYVSSSYTSPVYIDDDWDTYNFLNFPDLNEKIEDVRDTYENGLNFDNENKGALSFACGVLTEMQYSNSGSGTQTLYAGYAFSNRMGYQSVLNVYSVGNDFYSILSDDMVNGRPAMMSILGGPEGHCIITDGWNSDSDYYHLNMGWSGMDDGWYSLPQGMPSGYSVINDAVCNIEGGTIPVDIIGFVNAGGVNTANTEIFFDGAVDYNCITEDTGMFDLAFVHEGLYTVTATLALPDGGYYYHQQEEYISSSNTFIEINLDNFEFITGNITAPVDPAGTKISIYEDDQMVSNTVVESDGSYQMPGLLPGSYVMVASQPPHYGRVRHITVSLEEQNFDFELFDYQQSSDVSYASDPASVWSLIATTMSVAVKLTDDELGGMEQALISKVSFKAPLGPQDGQLWAQVWQENVLISETPVTDFDSNQDLQITLDNFAMVQAGLNYYVGYKIQSSNMDLAWLDEGPRVPGKGAWFRINSWTELPAATDANICITATIMHPMLNEDPVDICPAQNLNAQNYPNPFNPSTTISFHLDQDDFVQLHVYNIKGEKINTLNNRTLAAGNHSISWNGTDAQNKPVASGVYFYYIKTAHSSESQKMILLK